MRPVVFVATLPNTPKEVGVRGTKLTDSHINHMTAPIKTIGKLLRDDLRGLTPQRNRR